jgi:hypothetical protein
MPPRLMRLRHGGWSKAEGVLAKYAEGERGRGGVLADAENPRGRILGGWLNFTNRRENFIGKVFFVDILVR